MLEAHGISIVLRKKKERLFCYFDGLYINCFYSNLLLEFW